MTPTKCYAFSCVPELVPCWSHATGRGGPLPAGLNPPWYASFRVLPRTLETCPGLVDDLAQRHLLWRDYPYRTPATTGWMGARTRPPSAPASSAGLVFRHCSWPGTGAADDCYTVCGAEQSCRGFVCPCYDEYAGAQYVGPDCFRTRLGERCAMLSAASEWSPTDGLLRTAGVHNVVTAKAVPCRAHSDCGGGTVCGRDRSGPPAGAVAECYDPLMAQCDTDQRCAPGYLCLPEIAACQPGVAADAEQCRSETERFRRLRVRSAFHPCIAELGCRCSPDPQIQLCEDELCPEGNICAADGAACRASCAADAHCRTGYVCDPECRKCVRAYALDDAACFPYRLGPCNTCRASCSDAAGCAEGWVCDLTVQAGRCCLAATYDPAAGPGACRPPMDGSMGEPIYNPAEVQVVPPPFRLSERRAAALAASPRRGRVLAPNPTVPSPASGVLAAPPPGSPAAAGCAWGGNCAEVTTTDFLGRRTVRAASLLESLQTCADRCGANYGCDRGAGRCVPLDQVTASRDPVSTPCRSDPSICGDYACGASRDCLPASGATCRTSCSRNEHCRRGLVCSGSVCAAPPFTCLPCDPCSGGPAGGVFAAALRTPADCGGGAAAAPPPLPQLALRGRWACAAARPPLQLSCQWRAASGEWCADASGPVQAALPPAGAAAGGRVCRGDAECAPLTCRRPSAGGAGVCRASCSAGAHCAPDHSCVGGACSALRTVGIECAADTQCLSGFCRDGVCCEAPCSGPCLSCNAPFSPAGTCTQVVGPHSRCPECYECPPGPNPQLRCAPAPGGGGCAQGRGSCEAGRCLCHRDSENGFRADPPGVTALHPRYSALRCAACSPGFAPPGCRDPAPAAPLIPFSVAGASHRRDDGAGFLRAADLGRRAGADPSAWGPRVCKHVLRPSGDAPFECDPNDNWLLLALGPQAHPERVVVEECWGPGTVRAVELRVAPDGPAEPSEAPYNPDHPEQGLSGARAAVTGAPGARSARLPQAAEWVTVWSAPAANPPRPSAPLGACHSWAAEVGGKLRGRPAAELRLRFRAYSDDHALGAVYVYGPAGDPPPSALWAPAGPAAAEGMRGASAFDARHEPPLSGAEGSSRAGAEGRRGGALQLRRGAAYPEARAPERLRATATTEDAADAQRARACLTGLLDCEPPAEPPCAAAPGGGGCAPPPAAPPPSAAAGGWVEECAAEGGANNPGRHRGLARMPPRGDSEYPGGPLDCAVRRVPCFGRGRRAGAGSCQCEEGFAGESCGQCAPGFRGGHWELLPSGEAREWPCLPARPPAHTPAPSCRLLLSGAPEGMPFELLRATYRPECPRELPSAALTARHYAKRWDTPLVGTADTGSVRVCLSVQIADMPNDPAAGVLVVASSAQLPPTRCECTPAAVNTSIPGAEQDARRHGCTPAPNGVLSRYDDVDSRLLMGPLKFPHFVGQNYAGRELPDALVSDCSEISWPHDQLYVSVEAWDGSGSAHAADFAVSLSTILVEGCTCSRH
eukprot:TRINITY_DN13807_c0_g1_i3.p1 TRINITY_DN13807_c0_g1~~TRINITY_DN13807_c0_g1_i3.p1  ORF type:complete len:1495 (+),score=295.39 TRINITY_DN13807_c0_g1_i3:806-5290(+)